MKGGSIMKRNVVWGVLAVMGILALTVTTAHAGEGGIPFPLTSFFVCQGIHGDDPGKEVNVTDSVLLTNPQNVRIGNGVLACVVAKLFDVITGTEIDPNPGNATNNDGLKCYNVSVSRQPNSTPPTLWDVTDELFGMEPDIQASSFQYICAPATFRNPH
jgi:hypothetical protein